MNHPAGYKISPHLHNEVPRQVVFTNEALFIRSGKVRVDFYDEHRKYLESLVLHQGDVILLIGGGHGFEMLEPTEMIEVKQGPWTKLYLKGLNPPLFGFAQPTSEGSIRCLWTVL